MDTLPRISHDSLFEGKLRCTQPLDGYRFSIDSVLLAHFVGSFNKARILDMGCGCGILSLILAYRQWTSIDLIQGIELQKELASLAELNFEHNSFNNKCSVITGDYCAIKNVFKAESFSHCICNPPFYREGSGRVSAHTENLLARHQDGDSLSSIASTMYYSLKNKGSGYLIYPAERFSELHKLLVEHRLQPKTIRFVYSYPEAHDATLVLFQVKKNARQGDRIAQPLYIYTGKNGEYSEEVAAMYCP